MYIYNKNNSSNKISLFFFKTFQSDLIVIVLWKRIWHFDRLFKKNKMALEIRVADYIVFAFFFLFCANEKILLSSILTRLNGTVYMGPGFVINPIETSFDCESRQHSVLRSIAITRRHVDGSSFVMEGIGCMFSLLVPALCNSQLHSGPLVHYRDC